MFTYTEILQEFVDAARLAYTTPGDVLLWARALAYRESQKARHKAYRLRNLDKLRALGRARSRLATERKRQLMARIAPMMYQWHSPKKKS